MSNAGVFRKEVATLAVAMALLMPAACSTAPARSTPKHATPTSATRMDDFVRWALQGPSGYDQALAELMRLYRAQATSQDPPNVYARNPIRLADHFVIAGVQIDNQYWYRPVVAITVAGQPCYPMAQAAAVAGIELPPPGSDTGSPGRSVSARRNDMELTLTESRSDPRCVEDISFLHLKTERRAGAK